MIGVSVGNYVIAEKIGEGGMGVVYRASHQTLGRQVAVKVLHGDSHRAPELVSRFFNEAKAATEIRNEHIIDVLDFGHTQDGRPYIVMEWLEGESLAVLLAREPVLEDHRALDLLRGIGEALAAAHELGVIHRDLKPDNIFLQQKGARAEFIKVLDFGIAKLLQQDGPNDFKTRSGMLLGTPAYMSPEQCRGARDIDHRSDIYALGVIAYQMFTGHLPFKAEGLGELIYKHMSEAPKPPTALRPSIGEPVSAAILQALAKDPADRFAWVGEFIAALEAGLGAAGGVVSGGHTAPTGSNTAPGLGSGARSVRPLAAGSLAGATLIAPGQAPGVQPGTLGPRRGFATTLSPVEVASRRPWNRRPLAIGTAIVAVGAVASVGWLVVRGAGNGKAVIDTVPLAEPAVGIAPRLRPTVGHPPVPVAAPQPNVPARDPASSVADPTARPDAGEREPGGALDRAEGRRVVGKPATKPATKPSSAADAPVRAATASSTTRPSPPSVRDRGGAGGGPAVYRGRKLEIEREFP